MLRYLDDEGWGERHYDIYIYINDKNPDESKAVVDEIFVWPYITMLFLLIS